MGVVEEVSFRQETRGRPGTHTRWRRRLKPRFRLTWALQNAQIAADARADGLFPLLTNDPTLAAGQLLDAYKTTQPLVEKRHDLLKNVEAATPVYLKSISRIEALLASGWVGCCATTTARPERGMSFRPLRRRPGSCEPGPRPASSALTYQDLFLQNGGRLEAN